MTFVRLVASLLLAAGAFAALVVSAVLFARLPPSARAGTGAAWALEAPSFVLVDDDGRAAWVAFGRSACRVDLGRGEAVRCDALSFDTGGRVQHARGEGRLLLLSHDGASLALALLRESEDAPAFSSWTDPAATRLAVANVAWSRARSRFEIALDAGHGARDVRVLPVSADGAPGELEPLGVDPGELPPKASAASLLAAFAGAPPSLFLSEPLEHSDVHVVRGRAMTRLAVPGCERLAALSGQCALVSSKAVFRSSSAFAFALWLGADAEARGSSEAAPFDLIEHRGAPVLTTRSGAKLTVPFPLAAAVGDARVELEIVQRGGEEVLYGRKSTTSAWRKVARAAGAVEDWIAIPGEDNLVLLSGGRSIVVDRELERTDAHTTWARLKEILAERYAENPPGVIAYLAGLAIFAPLVLFVVAYVARTRRAPAWLAIALAIYGLATALFVYRSEDAIFPPDARDVTSTGGSR